MVELFFFVVFVVALCDLVGYITLRVFYAARRYCAHVSRKIINDRRARNASKRKLEARKNEGGLDAEQPDPQKVLDGRA